MDQYRFHADSMEKFTLDLKETSLRIRMETDKTVELTGGMIRDEAIAIAKKHSQTIPKTIHMDMIPGKAIIHAGNAATPLAILYEKGNVKSKAGRKFDSKRSRIAEGGKQLVFGHPVFGQGWTQQDRFPFLAPARTKVRVVAKKLMDAAWDKALEPLRLR